MKKIATAALLVLTLAACGSDEDSAAPAAIEGQAGDGPEDGRDFVFCFALDQYDASDEWINYCIDDRDPNGNQVEIEPETCDCPAGEVVEFWTSYGIYYALRPSGGFHHMEATDAPGICYAPGIG